MTDTHVPSHLRTCPSGPLHPELPEERSTWVLPLAPAGKPEPVWEMEKLLEGKEGKEMGQAGEWADRVIPGLLPGQCLQGRRGKKGHY